MSDEETQLVIDRTVDCARKLQGIGESVRSTNLGGTVALIGEQQREIARLNAELESVRKEHATLKKFTAGIAEAERHAADVAKARNPLRRDEEPAD